eukprot:4987798-Pyramimonas_sp.AAC.1
MRMRMSKNQNESPVVALRICLYLFIRLGLTSRLRLGLTSRLRLGLVLPGPPKDPASYGAIQGASPPLKEETEMTAMGVDVEAGGRAPRSH